MKTVDFSETITASDLKVGSCRQLIEIMKVVSIEGQSGAQFEGNLGEILALGAEISPYIGLREKWESP